MAMMMKTVISLFLLTLPYLAAPAVAQCSDEEHGVATTSFKVWLRVYGSNNRIGF